MIIIMTIRQFSFSSFIIHDELLTYFKLQNDVPTYDRLFKKKETSFLHHSLKSCWLIASFSASGEAFSCVCLNLLVRVYSLNTKKRAVKSPYKRTVFCKNRIRNIIFKKYLKSKIITNFFFCTFVKLFQNWTCPFFQKSKDSKIQGIIISLKN